VKSHLEARGLVPSLYPDLVVDEEEQTATFYLYSGDKLVGFQQYRPDQTSKKMNHPKEARYFTYLPREVDGVWGYGRDYSSNGSRVLFLVEGVFKAAALHRLGFNSVAVLGASPKRLLNQILLWRCRGHKVVALGDNDDAGRKFVRFVGRGCTTERDLDELTDKEVYEYARTFDPDALL
jgi:hypothetical protein